MVSRDGNEFVSFTNVRVVRSTAPALFCWIGGRMVWLPRRHISGRLWCIGDRGTLRIRRWIALDRQLLDAAGDAVAPRASAARLDGAPLHLVRKAPHAAPAE